VTGSQDGKLRLWDVASRKLIGRPLPGASSSDTWSSSAFFPDGRHVLGVFRTGEAIVWDVDPTAWQAASCRVANRELTRAEWQRFLPDRAFRHVCR
jgi:WD40 repeat protein